MFTYKNMYSFILMFVVFASSALESTDAYAYLDCPQQPIPSCECGATGSKTAEATTTAVPPPIGKRTCVEKRTLGVRSTTGCRLISPSQNVYDRCRNYCYTKSKGHYRGADCLPIPSSKKLIECRCFHDECRNSEMDVVFLLDSSYSLSPAQFQQEVDFIKNFTSAISLGQNASRVALVKFSTYSAVMFTFLDPVQSQQAIAQKLNSLQHDEYGYTNITGAFEVAKQVLGGTKRPNVPQVIVLVTDGEHNRGTISPDVPAADLRRDGVLIYALGIKNNAATTYGNAVDAASLRKITGDENRVFIADFSDLSDVVNSIGAEVTAKVNN